MRFRRPARGNLSPAELDVSLITLARGVECPDILGIIEIGAFLGGTLLGIGDCALCVLGAVAGQGGAFAINITS